MLRSCFHLFSYAEDHGMNAQDEREGIVAQRGGLLRRNSAQVTKKSRAPVLSKVEGLARGASFFILYFAFLLLLPSIVSAEEMTITTYYPSPNGAYDALNVKRLSVGDTNGDGSINASDVSASSGYLLVADKLGIGTRTPNGPLEVRGATSDRVFIAGTDVGDVNTNSPKLSFYGSGNSSNIIGPSIQKINTGPYGSGRLAFLQHNTGNYTNESEVMSILSNGNVGIGTSAPAALLDVNGQMVAGGVGAPPGSEPYTSMGSGSGISFADRFGTSYPRWVIYPNAGSLRFYNSSNGDAGVFTTAGYFGIGTTSPQSILESDGRITVLEGNRYWSLGAGRADGGTNGYPDAAAISVGSFAIRDVWMQRDRIRIDSAGNVGIGTTAPSQKLDVAGNMILNSGSAVATLLAGAANTGTSGNLSIAARDGDVMFRFWTDSGIAQINTAEGGSWSSASFDLAEIINYEKEASIESGDIIVSTGQKSGKSYADKSSYPYQETIIGIVSTQPAFVGGVPWEDNAINSPITSKALSLAGRVPTKVCTENGPIKVGDYLTSSLIPGVAMKATKSGQVVGKAMEEYKEKNPKKVGKITVFVNPVWFGGDIQKKTESLEKTIQEQQKQIEELRKEIGVLRKGRPFKWIPGRNKD